MPDLLAGPRGQAWTTALEAAQSLGVPLTCHLAGLGAELDDRAGTWPGLYGVSDDGAVLVRPDGHVAWRAEKVAAQPAAELAAVLRGVLSLS